jgi:hypothetical protein
VEFILLTLGMLVVLVAIFVVLARAFEDHGVAELLDWKPTRSYETEAQLEVDDVQQMIEAQNEMRRRRGAKEITEEDVQRQAREDESLRLRGRGPFAPGGGIDDEVDAPPPAKGSKASSKTAKARQARKTRSTTARSGSSRSTKSRSTKSRSTKARSTKSRSTKARSKKG